MRLGYFDDIIEALSWTAPEEADDPFDDEALEREFGSGFEADEGEAEDRPSATIGTSSIRCGHVGRNDPSRQRQEGEALLLRAVEQEGGEQ